MRKELVWQGNIHLGDEPGVFGQAAYSGLRVELPLTVESETGDPQHVELVLTTTGVKTYSGYPGHKVVVRRYVPNAALGSPNDFLPVVVLEERLTASTDPKRITIELMGRRNYLGVSLEVDNTVKPGLYDDFLWTRLDFTSPGYVHYASFGFR